MQSCPKSVDYCTGIPKVRLSEATAANPKNLYALPWRCAKHEQKIPTSSHSTIQHRRTNTPYYKIRAGL